MPSLELPISGRNTRQKSSAGRRRSFRKAFVPQISPFRKKSVTCSASFLVSRICSNSLFLTLARRRRSNCRFLEEIHVKRAPLGVVARSAGSSVPRICSFLCFPYFFVNLVRLCSSQRDVDKRAPIAPAPALTAHSSAATFDARVVD